MADIKLFRLTAGTATEVASQAAQVEKSLQTLFENNLETLLGVRFLSSEFSTGPVHGGRIDTLGLDEDGSPVIIEFKRAVSENVINQGLFYLEWLMDHKGDYQWLVQQRLGSEIAKNIDWSGPRLICIAGDFTRYDVLAVKQINRNIELLRYRKFGSDLLMVEMAHTPRVSKISSSPPADPQAQVPDEGVGKEPYAGQYISSRISKAGQPLRDLFDAVGAFLTSLGDDVQTKELKFYVAFKRIKNFACLEIYPQAGTVVAYLKLDPSSVAIENGFTRDVTHIGHWGTGNLEVVMKTISDLERAQPLLVRAYEGG